MRAIHINAPGGLDRLEKVQLPDPGAPRAGELRVRLLATSLNNHDFRVIAGETGAPDGRIPMADGAGVVEAVGDGVTGFATGDAVLSVFHPTWLSGPPVIGDFSMTPGDGVDGYARDVVVRSASWFTHAPAGFTHEEAATLPTAGVTAWRALVHDGAVKAGDTVLVLGTGGVSIFALQIGRSMGAKVVATTSSEEKAERLRRLGAAHVVNYREQPNWAAAVLDWTDGKGVDQVIEVGGAATLTQSVSAVRAGGHVSLIGAMTGRSGELPLGSVVARQVRLQGLTVGSRAVQEDLVRGLEASGIRPVIDRTFALEDLAEAFAYQKSGRHFGKIVVTI